MPRLKFIIWILVLGVAVNAAHAEIYRWVDENGKIHFTDKPPETAKTQKVRVQVNSFTSTKISPFKFDASLISKRVASTDVVMYSTTWCGYCKKARRYFTQQNIPFEEYDVEKSSKGKKDYKALKGRGVPIILVGERRMNGFSVASFEKLYSR